MIEFAVSVANSLIISFLVITVGSALIDWQGYTMLAKRGKQDVAWQHLLKQYGNRAITRWTILACVLSLLFMVVVGATAASSIGTVLGFVLALYVLQRFHHWRFKRYTLRQQGPKV